MNLEYVEIESIEELGEDETYDITMEDWPSFIANGIVVHNSGMRRLLKDLGSEGDLTFDDITAATALFRPGPMQSGMMEKYVKIKRGFEEPEYPHIATEPALKETYSVIVYQEQIMSVSRTVAGYTMAEADHLRKAFSKKDPAKMAEHRNTFVEGARAGYVEVTRDDGTTVKIHRKDKLKGKDGNFYTAEEAFAKGIDLIPF